MIQIILITKDSKIIDKLANVSGETGGEFQFCRISSESITSGMIDMREYDAAVIDIGDVQADLNVLFSTLKRNTIPFVSMGGYGHGAVLMQIVRDYDSLVLMRDPEYQFLQFIPGFVRKVLRDKDKDKTVAEGLCAINKRHEDLLQAIPDIIYRLDVRGFFTYVNRAITQIGYTPEELIGKHFSCIVAEEDVENVSRQFVLPKFRGKMTGDDQSPGLFDERRTQDRNTKNLEVRIKKNTDSFGETIAPEIVASILAYGEVSATGQYKDEAGEKIFTGTVGIIRDVSRKKKSENLLYLLSIAIEQSMIGVCIVDTGGSIEYANPHFSNLSGVAHDVMLRMSVHDLWQRIFHFEDTDAIFREAVEKGSWQDEFVCTPHEKQELWCWIRVYSVERFGEVTHFVIFQEKMPDPPEGPRE